MNESIAIKYFEKKGIINNAKTTKKPTTDGNRN